MHSKKSFPAERVSLLVEVLRSFSLALASNQMELLNLPTFCRKSTAFFKKFCDLKFRALNFNAASGHSCSHFFEVGFLKTLHCQ